MRANTFAGQVIAVLSCRTSAFEQGSAEPQTFPRRLRALLSMDAKPPVGRPVALPGRQASRARESFLTSELFVSWLTSSGCTVPMSASACEHTHPLLSLSGPSIAVRVTSLAPSTSTSTSTAPSTTSPRRIFATWT
jgi:hypothetical protein